MERIWEILKNQYIQGEDLKTDQIFLWANDEALKEYEHEEPPKALKCEFCGKSLYYRGLKHPFKPKTIWTWIKPENCDCEKSVKYKEEQERLMLEKQRKEQEEHRKREEKAKIDRLFEMSKMGERFKTRTFDNFIVNSENKKSLEIAKGFVENFEQAKASGLGIMFVGNYGAGKTHLACGIAIELIKKGIPVIYGTAITLLFKIKQTYGEEVKTSEWDLLDLYSTVDLLIIDDLGKEKPSEWVLEKLYHIINQRYENLKPTIITTNYDDVTLINRLSTASNSSTAEAIVSRLNEMCTGVYMNFEDHRKM